MILDSRIAGNSTYDIGNAIRSIDVTDVGLADSDILKSGCK